MQLEQLLHAVEHRSVFRCSVDLATLNPDGLVHPPTYAAKKGEPGPHLAFRKAWIDGAARDVVVLDSPQSQANRIELALLAAHRGGRLRYPDIEIHFPAGSGEPVYSVLQLSHRIYDAVMRASLDGQTAFFATDTGRALAAARPSNATALYTHAPVTLVLGAWDSNSGGGPLAAKIPRLLTSEIVGLDAQRAEVSATKFDTLDIRSMVAELVPTADSVRRFEIKAEGGKAAAKSVKGKKPSEYGFGSVPSSASPRAAVISGALQTSVLSCAGLRQLSFPDEAGVVDAQRDQAGRAVLAALGLYGLISQNESGYLLRARCELMPRAAARLELIGRTLQDTEALALDTDAALGLLQQACRHAETFGLRWRDEVLRLQADDRLVTLVQRSRDAAARGDSEQPDA